MRDKVTPISTVTWWLRHGWCRKLLQATTASSQRFAIQTAKSTSCNSSDHGQSALPYRNRCITRYPNLTTKTIKSFAASVSRIATEGRTTPHKLLRSRRRDRSTSRAQLPSPRSRPKTPRSFRYNKDPSVSPKCFAVHGAHLRTASSPPTVSNAFTPWPSSSRRTMKGGVFSTPPPPFLLSYTSPGRRRVP